MLEVGKVYKNGSGDEIKIVHYYSDGRVFPFVGVINNSNTENYTEEGRYLNNGRESDEDLIIPEVLQVGQVWGKGYPREIIAITEASGRKVVTYLTNERKNVNAMFYDIFIDNFVAEGELQ